MSLSVEELNSSTYGLVASRRYYSFNMSIYYCVLYTVCPRLSHRPTILAASKVGPQVFQQTVHFTMKTRHQCFFYIHESMMNVTDTHPCRSAVRLLLLLRLGCHLVQIVHTWSDRRHRR